MGGGRWTEKDWASYAARNIAGKSSVSGAGGIYSAASMDAALNPYGISFRESCDSGDNPRSTAIIVALDVTGSMSSVLGYMATEGLNKIVTEIYNRKPVPDPHIMVMGVGDVVYDLAPLQVTQFEADIRIAEALTKIWFERGGGGNNSESYTLPWYFAANHTKTDCYEKRGKKGYLFTIGDECPPAELSASQIREVTGDSIQADKYTAEELLNQVSRTYEVFHLIIEEGSYCRTNRDKVREEWSRLLGQRAIMVSDHTKLSEIIVSTLQIINGEDNESVIGSWDGSTSIVVRRAVGGLAKAEKDNCGLVTF